MPQRQAKVRLFSCTPVYGEVATLLHYNAFSRILAELSNRYHGVPLPRFFGDFGTLGPTFLTRQPYRHLRLSVPFWRFSLKVQNPITGAA